MDNVTHALAGALIGAATIAVAERRGARGTSRIASRTAVSVAAIVAAELPDADLLYAGAALGMGKLGYLLHHRGHTHTVLFAVLAALAVWGVTLGLRRDLRNGVARNALLAATLAGTLSHLALDYTNSYGIHPFWPVVNRWFYGDAVFIVEPWLFIIAIPPLFLLATGTITRGILVLLLAVMLAAAWFISMVGTGVAAMLTVAALAWWLFMRRVAPQRRSMYAIVAWILAELMFFTGAASARRVVRETTGAASYRDAVLTPAIGNPLCFNVIVVELDGATYRASAATVATVPAVRSVASCARTATQAEQSVGERASERAGTNAMRWGGSFSAPLAELRALVDDNCEIAAAMRFIRVPVWDRLAGDSIRFADLRYRDGGGGFATIVTDAHPATCPRHVPGWVPPRQDMLE